MGTNFYLQSRVPVHTYPQVHLTKRSWGWLPLFEEHEEDEELYEYAVEEFYEHEVNRQFTNDIKAPNIHSIEDIKKAVDDGRWRIVDEYGEEYTWERFYKEVIQWNGGDHDNPDFIPNNHKDLASKGFKVRKDKDGYEWTDRDFR